jgi:hypothetical protein
MNTNIMAARASLLACLLVLAATTPLLRGARAAFTWEACDGDAAPFKASNVALTPDPPVIGGSVTFTIDAAAGACYVWPVAVCDLVGWCA